MLELPEGRFRSPRPKDLIQPLVDYRDAASHFPWIGNFISLYLCSYVFNDWLSLLFAGEILENDEKCHGKKGGRPLMIV